MYPADEYNFFSQRDHRAVGFLNMPQNNDRLCPGELTAMEELLGIILEVNCL